MTKASLRQPEDSTAAAQTSCAILSTWWLTPKADCRCLSCLCNSRVAAKIRDWTALNARLKDDARAHKHTRCGTHARAHRGR